MKYCYFLSGAFVIFAGEAIGLRMYFAALVWLFFSFSLWLLGDSKLNK